MARIRVIKYSQSNKKNQPKIAYFHNSNFNKMLKTLESRKTKGTKVKVVALNKNQASDYVKRKGNKKNNRVMRFHV